MDNSSRQLILNKGSQKYIFRYEAGAEEELLDALVDQAQDAKTDFDWFDAAVVSFKLTKKLVEKSEELIRKDTPELK